MKYGMLTQDPTVIWVNLVGSIIEGIYTGLFFLYTKNKVLIHSIGLSVNCFQLTVMLIK